MRRPRASARPTAVVLAVLHAAALTTGISIVVTHAGGTVLRPLLLLFLALVCGAAVLWPGSGAGLVAILGVVGGYLVLTGLGSVLRLAESPSAARVLLLGGCLYVAHATDALRAAAPGADLDRSVVLRWLRRLAETLVPGLLAGALVLTLPVGDGASPVWLLGALAVVGAAAVPALRVQRRPWQASSAGTRPPASGDGPAGKFQP